MAKQNKSTIFSSWYYTPDLFMAYKTAYPIFAKNSSLLVCTLLLLLQACKKHPDTPNATIKRQIDIADSLYIADKSDDAKVLLAKLRARINPADPSISLYYCQWTQYYHSNPAVMNAYADSAIAYFDYGSRKTDYPDAYFKTLLTKGDACLKAAKYILALRYYYRARDILPGTSCDNSNLASKIGGIYYDQRKYLLAARYFADSYNVLANCNEKLTQQKLFFLKQGALNNSGFSYELAGKLDSAEYYYLADLKLIKATDSLKLISKYYTDGALEIAYDNLGGLNIKKGNFTLAEEYLDKCMAISMDDRHSGVRIPPLLKLTQVYLKKGEYQKAGDALKRSKYLLDSYFSANSGSLPKWTLLYAEYLSLTGKPAEAYRYQTDYSRLKDSADNNSSDLYRLDVERELNTLQQEQSLVVLKQKNNLKKLYLLGIGVVAMLSVVIIVLAYRSLNRSRQANINAALQNSRLQASLAQVELLNTNYIRVMRVMAHDLRNPLSGIMGLTAMIREEESNLNEENRHLLKLIESTSKSSLEMINELLESGLADHNNTLETQLQDVRALLFDSVELLQFKANEKQQYIRFDSVDEEIVAPINRESIWRVFNNLIINAIKFSHEGTEISVDIVGKANTVLITVTDNGIGIPERDKDTIFEMFTPAKKTGTRGEQPFGLGLSISKKIIEAHGGRIWFKSRPDKGTVFYVELPR
ncbi:tetratricopeptide repeat-containing sensor histidine kinase [Mucilaginibacter psychrotolerans]|uniref:tetratricopeptide repeat-containing sensor histidine kinase n=1 Tax=Mucilaginibacter psychrotolerans TaxID=1524096 RepID=UPI00130536F8|nr:ATP-binding protein [Mucilaginibacter psychrotolerans]